MSSVCSIDCTPDTFSILQMMNSIVSFFWLRPDWPTQQANKTDFVWQTQLSLIFWMALRDDQSLVRNRLPSEELGWVLWWLAGIWRNQDQYWIPILLRWRAMFLFWSAEELVHSTYRCCLCCPIPVAQSTERLCRIPPSYRCLAIPLYYTLSIFLHFFPLFISQLGLFNLLLERLFPFSLFGLFVFFNSWLDFSGWAKPHSCQPEYIYVFGSRKIWQNPICIDCTDGPHDGDGFAGSQLCKDYVFWIDFLHRKGTGGIESYNSSLRIQQDVVVSIVHDFGWVKVKSCWKSLP